MRRYLLVIFCAVLLTPRGFPAAAQDHLPTLAEQIMARDDLSIFKQLLDLSDPPIRAWLDSPANQFTVFAPTDAAWEQYFNSFGDSLEALVRRPNGINDLLRYHIVPAAIAPQDIFQVYCSDLGTMLPDSRLVISERQGLLVVNYDSLLGSPLLAANGMLYEVDHVLLEVVLFPSSGDHTPDDIIQPTSIPDPPLFPVAMGADVRTILEQEGNFSTLLSLLADSPAYQSAAHSDGIYVLLAPTDTAFERYFRDNNLSLETFQATYGTAFAAYSLWPGYFFPATLQEYALYKPAFCASDLMGAAQMESTGDTGWTVDQVLYTGAVLFAHNTVIYVIDGIRLPQPRFMG